MWTAPWPEKPAETIEDEEQDVLSLKDLLGIVRRRFWLILLFTVLFTAISIGYSLSQTPQYEASARLLLVVKDDTVSGQQSPSDPEGDANAIQLLSETMAQGMQNKDVAEEVVRRLDLKTTPKGLLNDLRVELVPNTNLLDAVVSDSDPQTARDIANAVAEAATQEEIPLNDTADNSLVLTVWEKAETPSDPVEPQPARGGLVGLILGLMAGVGLVFLLEYLDGSLRSPEQAEHVLGVPVFGTIPNQKLPKDKGKNDQGVAPDEAGGDLSSLQYSRLNGHLITTADPTGPAADAYRVLRSMLLHASYSSARVIVLAGAGGDDGGGDDGAATCANLGVTLAQAGKRTLILDCRFHDSATERLFGIGNSQGLADVLVGKRNLEEVWCEPLPGLRIVPSGSAPRDPAVLVESEHFPTFLAGVKRRFDYVLIDALPLEAASDTVTLSAYSDGVLLVARAREASVDAVQRAVRGVRIVGSNVLGLVVSGVEVSGHRESREDR